MFNCHDEPTLDDVLADPLVRLVMQADHVEPLAFEAMLGEAARRAGPASSGRGGPCSREVGY
jgi:hypothetical protein